MTPTATIAPLVLILAGAAACAGEPQFALGGDGGQTGPGDSALRADVQRDAGALADADRDASDGVAPDGHSIDGGRSGVAVSGDVGFGGVNCGEAAHPRTVTVWNTSDAGWTFHAALGRHDASPFAIHPADGLVRAHESASITVTPRSIPQVSTVPGDYADTLLLTTTAPDDAPHIVHLTESAQGAILAFDTQSIPFGDVPVSTSESSTFHVTNSGSLAVSATLGLAAGSSPGFGVSPRTSQMISGSLKLSSTATFSPTAAGGETGAIALTVDSSAVLCAPLPQPLTLTGTGENGGLTVSTNALAFGSTACGHAAAAQDLKLTNSGNSPLTWSVSLSNTSPSPYSVGPTTTGALMAGASVTLTVTPGPIPAQSTVQANYYADTITINTDVVGDAPHVVTLSQTAKGAIFAFNPASVGFGDVPVNTTGMQPFQVMNTGNSSANVTLTPSAPAFTVMGPMAVGGGKDGDFTASFAPGNNRTLESATMTLSVGATDVLCAPLPAPLAVSGTGTSGVVAFSPSSLTFGNQPAAGLTACGTQAPAQQVTFTNAGNEDYTISGALGGGKMSPYTFAIAPASGVVAANGGSATVTVTPTLIPQTSGVPGSYNDVLTITSTAAGDMPHAISLNQSAFGAILSAPPAMIAFPATPVGAESNFQVGITNTGNAPATLTWGAISSDVFTFDTGVVLPPGGVTTNSNAHFIPTMPTPYSGTAVMHVTASTILCQPMPSPAVMLSGTGTSSPTVSITPDPVDFSMVPCGTAGGTRVVTIKNGGAAAITWTAALTSGTSFGISPPSGSIVAGATGTLTVTSNVIPVSASTTTAANGFGDTLTITTSALGDSPHAIPVQETASGAILGWNPASLNLPASARGQPVLFALENSGNTPATVTLSLNNPGPATLTLGSPTTGTATSGAPLQSSVTEGLASVPSSNATVTATPANGTVLCQPAPAPLAITAN